MTITLAGVGSGDVKGRQRVEDEKKGPWGTYTDASLATAGAILIAERTDNLVVGVCD